MTNQKTYLLFGPAVFLLIPIFSMSCSGYLEDFGSGQEQAIQFQNNQEGIEIRSQLVTSATVDGNSVPNNLAELIAGEETRKVCEKSFGTKVTCQPKLINENPDGKFIIRFADLKCDFIKPSDPDFEMPGGRTEKFLCRTTDENGKTRVIRVKYGNPEVHTEVAANRLLWKMGFAVDNVQPVTVVCRGCPEAPWDLYQKPELENQLKLDPSQEMRWAYASIEEKFDSEAIKLIDDAGNDVLEGFRYEDLLHGLDENSFISVEQKARRQALVFMNAFLMNYDTKNENQRLGCINYPADKSTCTQAVAIPHDMGFSFGGGTRSFKLDLDLWKNVPVWKDRKTCDASKSFSGLGLDFGVKLKLGEAGRTEVSRLLRSFTEQDLGGIFTVARFDGAAISHPQAAGTLSDLSMVPSEWTKAFLKRVSDFHSVANCPLEQGG